MLFWRLYHFIVINFNEMSYATWHLHSKHLYPLFSQFSNEFLKIPGLPSLSWRIIMPDITEKFEIIRTHFLASQAHLLLFCYRTHTETVPCSPYVPLLAACAPHLTTIQGLIEEFSLFLLWIWFHLSKVSQISALRAKPLLLAHLLPNLLMFSLCTNSFADFVFTQSPQDFLPKSFLNLPSPFLHLLAPLPF